MIFTPQLGTTIDRSYHLQEQLGQGGMGTVYRAATLVNNQTIALKLVSGQLFAEQPNETHDQALSRKLALAHEFQTLASLHHPNVIRVLSYGFDEQFGSYFTMQMLDSAQNIVEACFGKSEEAQVNLIAQLLRALVYVHQRGVLHRDIKPGNVLVVDGEAKLLDFGIAVEHPENAEFGGTIEYMAPELLRGKPPSRASDLYAVGVLFHQILAGKLPGSPVSMSGALDEILGDSEPSGEPPLSFDDALDALDFEENSPPVAIDVSGPLGAILTRLLAPNPAERYDDAATALRDLAAAVSYELPVETAATRESFLRATVLVGREKELATLSRALKDIKLTAGSSFLVGGESGVGKSRLIAELRTLALVHGCWVADGQCVSEGGYYYHEWLPLLRELCFRSDMTDAEASVLKDLVSDIGELLGRPIPNPPPVKPEGVQARIVSTLVGLLSRQSKPLVLFIEDLQWGRSESLGLLTQLYKHAAHLPLLLIGTYRADEAPQLPQSLPDMQHFLLMRLDPQDIAKLSESMLGPVGKQPQLVSYLARQTEGNVFFLIEIVRTLAENAGELVRIGQGELPESLLTIGIERIALRRLDHVPASFRPWLDFAATLGRKLDQSVMEQAFPELPMHSFLIECANAAVLDSQGSNWSFAHNKLREAILHRLDPNHRKDLHHKVANAIEAAYPDAKRDAMSATLAYHFEQAGVLDKALRYYIRAGDSAIKLYLLKEAREHFAFAKATLEQLSDTPELRRLHVDLLLKQVLAGLYNDANQAQLVRLSEARQLLESLHDTSTSDFADRLRMARIDYYCGRVYHYSGQPKEAIKFCERVLPVAKEFADLELTIMSSYMIGLALSMQGRFGEARDLLQNTIEPLGQFLGPSLDTLRCVMYYCIMLAASGRGRQALSELENARKLANQLNHPLAQGIFLIQEASAALVMLDWQKTLQISERLLSFGEAMLPPMALDLRAWAQSYLGQHAEAIASRQRAVTMRKATGGGVLTDWFDAAEAEILFNAGRTEEALAQACKVAAASAEAGLPFSHAIAERIWGCALSRLGGDAAAADVHFLASLKLCQSTEQVMNAAQTELFWGRICRERGDIAGATQHFTNALKQIESGGYEYALVDFRRIANGN